MSIIAPHVQVSGCARINLVPGEDIYYVTGMNCSTDTITMLEKGKRASTK